MHPPGTPKPSKNTFLLQQEWVFEGFGVPGGCKSILNVKCLHKSYIAELFGPRVFCFSVGRIFVLVGKNPTLIAPPPPFFFLNIFLDRGGAIKVGIEVFKIISTLRISHWYPKNSNIYPESFTLVNWEISTCTLRILQWLPWKFRFVILRIPFWTIQ